MPGPSPVKTSASLTAARQGEAWAAPVADLEVPERPMRLPYASELKRQPKKRPSTCWARFVFFLGFIDPTSLCKECCFGFLDFLGWWFGAMRFARGIERQMQDRFEELARAEHMVSDEARKAKLRLKMEGLHKNLAVVKSSNPKTGKGQPPTYFRKVKKPRRKRNSAALNPDVPEKRPILRITVERARDLRRSDWTPASGFLPPDPYFTVSAVGLQKTVSGVEDVQYKTTDPVWNTTFEICDYVPGGSLEFKVWDKDVGADDLLGVAILEAPDFFPDGLHAELLLQTRGLVKGVQQYLTVQIEVIYPKAKGWGGDALRRRDVPQGWESGVLEEDEDDEEPVCQTPPFFVIAQVLFCGLVWAFNQGSSVAPMSGLESLAPGQTTLITQRDCTKDYRAQPWRFWSYQFTHVGMNHIGMNCLMLIIMGIPLEGFNGTLLTAFMFNIGVFGGACCWMVSDIHQETVGMSGGCYALIGITMGSLWMNRDENKYFKTAMLMCFLIPAIDLVQAWASPSEGVSHAAHAGGAFAGLLAALAFGRNMDVSQNERKLSIAAFVLGIGLAAGCLAWGLAPSVPRDIFEQVGYCWWRQVIAPSIWTNSTSPHCVRCDTADCASAWQAAVAGADCVGKCAMGTVSFADCERFGGWSEVSPR